MQPTNKQPLFIITGASGVGKSTMCKLLFAYEKDYIVMESDLLWNNVYNTPEDDYKAYRKVWMNICANISQIGLPVVLCGCAVPAQYENLEERRFFTKIHYLAVVCDNDVLISRMKNGRQIQDEAWIKSSVDFNNWLKSNAALTTPGITLLDNSSLSPKQAAQKAKNWIRDNIL